MKKKGIAEKSGAFLCVADGDAMGELDAFDDERQAFGPLQTVPFLRGGADKGENHRLRRLP